MVKHQKERGLPSRAASLIESLRRGLPASTAWMPDRDIGLELEALQPCIVTEAASMWAASELRNPTALCRFIARCLNVTRHFHGFAPMGALCPTPHDGQIAELIEFAFPPGPYPWMRFRGPAAGFRAFLGFVRQWFRALEDGDETWQQASLLLMLRAMISCIGSRMTSTAELTLPTGSRTHDDLVAKLYHLAIKKALGGPAGRNGPAAKKA